MFDCAAGQRLGLAFLDVAHAVQPFTPVGAVVLAALLNHAGAPVNFKVFPGNMPGLRDCGVTNDQGLSLARRADDCNPVTKELAEHVAVPGLEYLQSPENPEGKGIMVVVDVDAVKHLVSSFLTTGIT